MYIYIRVIFIESMFEFSFMIRLNRFQIYQKNKIGATIFLGSQLQVKLYIQYSIDYNYKRIKYSGVPFSVRL